MSESAIRIDAPYTRDACIEWRAAITIGQNPDASNGMLDMLANNGKEPSHLANRRRMAIARALAKGQRQERSAVLAWLQARYVECMKGAGLELGAGGHWREVRCVEPEARRMWDARASAIALAISAIGSGDHVPTWPAASTSRKQITPSSSK